MAERFIDKTVIVTGAAGGIGRATVERLAREGARIVAVDLIHSLHQRRHDVGLNRWRR